MTDRVKHPREIQQDDAAEKIVAILKALTFDFDREQVLSMVTACVCVSCGGEARDHMGRWCQCMEQRKLGVRPK